MMTMTPAWRRRLKITLAILVVLGAALSAFVWYKFFRLEPQVFANEVERFKYGSIGAEDDRGLPYYIWLVLPRIFPDKLPGSGGRIYTRRRRSTPRRARRGWPA